MSNLDITRDKSGNTDIGARKSHWTDTAAVSLFTEPPVCVYKEASAICQGDGSFVLQKICDSLGRLCYGAQEEIRKNMRRNDK